MRREVIPISQKLKEKITLNIPLVDLEQTVSSIMKSLAVDAQKYKTINYIYVVDKNNKLLGVFSIKELFRANPSLKVKDLAKPDVIFTYADSSPEEVVLLALRHRLKAIPIVNQEKELIGVVTSDDLLSILHEKTHDEIFKLTQASISRKIVDLSVPEITRVRLPWLIFSIVGGIIAGGLISLFQGVLGTYFALILYIPLLMIVGINVGNQSAIIYIRGLISHRKFDLLRYIVREIKIGFLLGLISGGVLFVVSKIWQESFLFALSLVVSILLAVIVSALIGIFVPWFLNKINKDPLMGAGILISFVEGVVSLAVYFIIASLILG